MKIKCLWCGSKTGETIDDITKYELHKCKNEREFQSHVKTKLKQ